MGKLKHICPECGKTWDCPQGHNSDPFEGEYLCSRCFNKAKIKGENES